MGTQYLHSTARPTFVLKDHKPARRAASGSANRICQDVWCDQQKGAGWKGWLGGLGEEHKRRCGGRWIQIRLSTTE